MTWPRRFFILAGMDRHFTVTEIRALADKLLVAAERNRRQAVEASERGDERAAAKHWAYNGIALRQRSAMKETASLLANIEAAEAEG